jgi:twitching motility protein PilT
MQTFDQHLADLVHSGEVAYEVAHAAATRPGDFDLQMRMLGGGQSRGQSGNATGSAPAVTPTATAAAPAGAAGGIATGAGFDFLGQS